MGIEKLRKKQLTYFLLVAIPIVVGINIFLLGFTIEHARYFPVMPVLFHIVFTIVFTGIIYNVFSRKYVNEVKETHLRKMLNDVYEDVIYSKETGIDKKTISSLNVLDMGDDYYSNDYIKAKYKNIEFETSDIRITETYTDSDGDRHTRTLFAGKWIILDFNKTFKSNVNLFSNKLRGYCVVRNNVVKLEDLTFNKKFTVTASNELDAFYIFTPHFMERILELKDKVKCPFVFAFSDNKIHVGLYGYPDQFENYSLFKKFDSNKIKIEIEKQMETILKLVEELNLNNDLFKGE